MKNVVKIYVRRKEWRWSMADKRNGRIIGASTESYKNRHQAINNLKRVTGISYVPALGYGTKEFTFEFQRRMDGGIVGQTEQ